MSKSTENPMCNLCGHSHSGVAHIWDKKPPAAPAPKRAPVRPMKGGDRAKPSPAKPQRPKTVAKKPTEPKPAVIASLKEQVEKAAASSSVIVSTRDREKYNAYHRDRRAAMKLGLTVEAYRKQQAEAVKP